MIRFPKTVKEMFKKLSPTYDLIYLLSKTCTKTYAESIVFSNK